MKESLQSEVTLEDIPLRGFKLLMTYIYTGQLRLKEMDDDTILELLGIAHLYGFGKLQDSLCHHLRENLSIRNVCAIYSVADLLGISDLSEACHRLMIKEPNAVLRSGTFADLARNALLRTISHDTFCADEMEIFKAVVQWCAGRPFAEDHSEVLRVIRLPLIRTTDLVTTVRDSGVIPTDAILDAIKTKKCRKDDLSLRGYLRVNENLVGPNAGAEELTADARGDLVIEDKDFVFRRTPLSSRPSVRAREGLIIALDKPSFINTIQFGLPNALIGHHYLSGYVEGSANFEKWIRLGSFLNEAFVAIFCLDSRVIRYLRIFLVTTREVSLAELEVAYVDGVRR